MIKTLFDVLRENPEQVNAAVASLALLVSLLSIVLTVVTLYLQRRHNYKSLTPIASFPIADYENRISVRLKNSGIGPLIVETLRVTNGREEYRDVISWIPGLPEGVEWTTFFNEADGECIPAGSYLVLLELKGDPENRHFAAARDSCRRALAALTITISYRDIYDRRMPRSERSLSYFGRHFVGVMGQV